MNFAGLGRSVLPHRDTIKTKKPITPELLELLIATRDKVREKLSRLKKKDARKYANHLKILDDMIQQGSLAETVKKIYEL